MWSELLQFARGHGFFNSHRSRYMIERDNAAVRVLFVCMGNICRSPTAEGVFRRMLEDLNMADKVFVDSAGTHSYHSGAPPDKRARQAAALRGVDLSRIRARRVEPRDFLNFDYVLAMDEENYRQLFELAETVEQRDKIGLLMDYAPELPEREVPDPYYGAMNGFDRVLDLIEEASQGLLVELRERYRL